MTFPIQAATDAILFYKIIVDSNSKQTDQAKKEIAESGDEIMADSRENVLNTLIDCCASLLLSCKVNEYERVKIKQIVTVMHYNLTNRGQTLHQANP